MVFVMKFYVYVHKKASDGAVFYVGKGCGKRAWKKSDRSDWWKAIENKYGRVVEIIAKGLSEDEAFAMEQKMIMEIGRCSLCNLTDGGEGGKSPSEETRRKMSESRKGRKASPETITKKRIASTGRNHSEETKKKIREARAKQVMPPMSEETRENLRKINTGKKVSAETGRKISRSKLGVKLGPMSDAHKEKLRAANLGKTHTAEAKAKVSIANTGRRHTNEEMRKIFECNRKSNAARRRSIKCSNGMVFGYSVEAEAWLRENGFPKAGRSNIVACCTGNLASAYGFVWCYND